MPRICPALLAAAAACCIGTPSAWAEDWLTIHGFPEQVNGDLIQVNPTPVPWQDRFTIDVRTSRSTLRDGYHNHPYRSFQAVAVIDCATRKGWYLSIEYFTQPMWQGPSSGRKDFRENEAPVAFNAIPGEPARKLIAAVCKAR